VLRRIWSLLLIEVGLARVVTGFILPSFIICFALMFIVTLGALFAPGSLGLQFEDFGSILFFTAIGFPIGFIALNGPLVAIGLFLASVWHLVFKRLSLVVLFCSFAIAASGIYGVNMPFVDDLKPPALTSYFDLERIWVLFLRALPFVSAVIYVYIDPRYRKKNEL
jgi:hypothetical protein